MSVFMDCHHAQIIDIILQKKNLSIKKNLYSILFIYNFFRLINKVFVAIQRSNKKPKNCSIKSTKN